MASAKYIIRLLPFIAVLAILACSIGINIAQMNHVKDLKERVTIITRAIGICNDNILETEDRIDHFAGKLYDCKQRLKDQKIAPLF